MINNLVFAGGGARCFWQLGFWLGARQSGAGLEQSATYVASVSAGCAMATAALLQRELEALALMKELTAANAANIHWRNLRTRDPLFPHAAMNRYAMETLLGPADLKLLRRVSLEYLMARYPRYLTGSVAALVAFSLYGVEKQLRGRVHPRWTRKLGFTPLIAASQDAKTIGELIEMIIGSSCVPPVMPCNGYRGEPVLDGGVIDNVPAFMTDGRSGDTLVLLSKRYKGGLPTVPGRIYVQPSQAIALDKFDYANPDGLQATFDLGLNDGRLFAEELNRETGTSSQPKA